MSWQCQHLASILGLPGHRVARALLYNRPRPTRACGAPPLGGPVLCPSLPVQHATRSLLALRHCEDAQ
eukprot:10472378-Alexandrium_andersonii.AAC.1